MFFLIFFWQQAMAMGDGFVDKKVVLIWKYEWRLDELETVGRRQARMAVERQTEIRLDLE